MKVRVTDFRLFFTAYNITEAVGILNFLTFCLHKNDCFDILLLKKKMLLNASVTGYKVHY